MSYITVIDFWFVSIQNLMNLIRCLLRNSASTFCNVWNFFSNVKQTLKKVRPNSCRTDVLHNCNRLLIGLNLNFDPILTYQRSYFTESYTPFVLHMEFFLKCEIALKRIFIHAEGMSRITVIDC